MRDIATSREISRFLQYYAKKHYAGAFSTPIAQEISRMTDDELQDHADLRGLRTVVVSKRLTRDSARRDFTGRRFVIPAGTRIVTHIARHDSAEVPSFEDYDLVFSYIEDRELTEALRSQGRVLTSANISAASEIIACWGRKGTETRWDPVDLVTVGRLPIEIPEAVREGMRREIQPLAGWDDDYPYYSDGTWSALSLRGFYRDDPTKGVKPSEMPKKWKDEHVSDLSLSCDWTRLAEDCPTIVSWINSVGWWTNLERVRLLRMEGNNGKGGSLKRHTDITDRNAGTRNGQIARFHIALQTNPDIKMTAWSLMGEEVAIHLAPFDCWYLDQRKPHAVANPTGTDRVHLVVDVVVDEDVRKQIRAASL